MEKDKREIGENNVKWFDMNKTKIEYLTHTWNPLAMRCTPISSSCTNCWHLAMAKRLAKNPSIYRDQQKAYAGGPPMLDYKELEAPFHLKKPARIGVQFMGDLFHENIDGEFLKDIFSVMRACDRHTFFLLTKRPQNVNKKYFEYFGNTSYSHVWLGVSVEDQKNKDRIDILRQIPSIFHWLSLEPLLEDLGTLDLTGIHWVTLGGETGPKARPLHPEWVRSVVQQCKGAGVPMFVKQLSGKDAKNMDKWPEELQVREIP